jgi:GntR family transcriptional regulator
MQFQLDFRSGLPIYLQIAEHIRQKVAAGELKAGDQLPTVRQMALDLRVNFNTVARAYRLLDESGLISTQQGRGTYIWEEAAEQTKNRLREEILSTLVERFINDARRQGYSLEEVQAVLKAQWKPPA